MPDRYHLLSHRAYFYMLEFEHNPADLRLAAPVSCVTAEGQRRVLWSHQANRAGRLTGPVRVTEVTSYHLRP